MANKAKKIPSLVPLFGGDDKLDSKIDEKTYKILKEEK